MEDAYSMTPASWQPHSHGAAGWEQSPPPAFCVGCQQRHMKIPPSLGAGQKNQRLTKLPGLVGNGACFASFTAQGSNSSSSRYGRKKGLVEECLAKPSLNHLPPSQPSTMMAMRLRRKVVAFFFKHVTFPGHKDCKPLRKDSKMS